MITLNKTDIKSAIMTGLLIELLLKILWRHHAMHSGTLAAMTGTYFPASTLLPIMHQRWVWSWQLFSHFVKSLQDSRLCVPGIWYVKFLKFLFKMFNVLYFTYHKHWWSEYYFSSWQPYRVAYRLQSIIPGVCNLKVVPTENKYFRIPSNREL